MGRSINVGAVVDSVVVDVLVLRCSLFSNSCSSSSLQCWEGKDIIAQGRQMLGETQPLASKPGSIRGDYSIDLGRNICHGSDSPESAAHE